jgi:uncharacterized protein HemX
MLLRARLARTTDLTRLPLMLTPAGPRRGAWLRAALLLAALLAGAAGSHVYWSQELARWREGAVPIAELRRAEAAAAQAQLQLGVSEAHGRELEHQIDGLNQRLRESQEELAFFRKGRDTKR